MNSAYGDYSFRKPSSLDGTIDGPISKTSNESHDHAIGLESTLKPQGKWNERAHSFLDRLDAQLEEKMPPNKVQKVLDGFYEESIEPLLQKGHKFNEWIDKNDYGSWYKDLTAFIVKLPIRAVRNIVRLAFNIIKGAVYAFVHPLKALNNLAHIFINFIESLLIPATYTKVGAGIMGAAAGNAIYGFGLHSMIGLGIGGSLIGIGLISGAIKSGVEAQKGEKFEAVKAELWNQLKSVPECALTGFFLGLIFGGIQKAVSSSQATTNPQETTTFVQPGNATEAQNFVNKALLSKGVTLDPSSYQVTFNPNTEMFKVTFAGPELKNTLTTLSQHNLIEPQVVIDHVNSYTMTFDQSLLSPGHYSVYSSYVDSSGYTWNTISNFGPSGASVPIETTIPLGSGTPIIPAESMIPASFSGSIAVGSLK